MNIYECQTGFHHKDRLPLDNDKSEDDYKPHRIPAAFLNVCPDYEVTEKLRFCLDSRLCDWTAC